MGWVGWVRELRGWEKIEDDRGDDGRWLKEGGGIVEGWGNCGKMLAMKTLWK